MRNINQDAYQKRNSSETSGQDGGMGKCNTRILPQPQKNYNWTTEPSFRTTWNLAEWKSYN